MNAGRPGSHIVPASAPATIIRQWHAPTQWQQGRPTATAATQVFRRHSSSCRRSGRLAHNQRYSAVSGSSSAAARAAAAAPAADRGALQGEWRQSAGAFRAQRWRRSTSETAAPCAAFPDSGLELGPPSCPTAIYGGNNHAAVTRRPPQYYHTTGCSYGAGCIRHGVAISATPGRQQRGRSRKFASIPFVGVSGGGCFGAAGGWVGKYRGRRFSASSCRPSSCGTIAFLARQQFCGCPGARHVCFSAADCVDTAALPQWAGSNCVRVSRQWKARPESRCKWTAGIAVVLVHARPECWVT